METTSLYYLTTILFFLFLFIFFFHTRPTPPHPTTTAVDGCPSSGHPIIGNLVAFLKNRHRFLDWASDMLSASPTGTIQVHGFLNLARGVCTADPLNVDHLLRANFPNYVKGKRYASVLSDLLGHGIFNADADLWSLQRKVASREFTTRSLRSFVADTVRDEVRGRLIPYLSAAADSGVVVDLQEVLCHFAFDNICNLAFGTDPACLDVGGRPPPFVDAFDEAVKICSDRFFSPVPVVWKLKRILNIGSERRLRDAICVINEYAAKIICSKRRQGSGCGDRLDLLSRFTACLDDDGGGGDEELRLIPRDEKGKEKFLRDIIISFVLAGKDSTSTALTWFFWLLSENQRCERRILSEISELDDFDSYDELKQLHYLHAAISEALRLYPPVPIDSRVALSDDVLPDGTRVGAGWFADYSAYAMARAERIWGADCREYLPERWLDLKGEFVAAEACRFPVFHAGPRACLGREMAYVQMKSVAAAVLSRFKVMAAAGGGGGEIPEYELSLTLKKKGGFPVRLRRRIRDYV